jgi:peptidoglycan hydrolase-like protein with peptidoglycan-binding domain
LAIAVLAGCLTLNSSAKTQTTAQTTTQTAPQTTPTDNATPTPTPDNAVMITVFLKHDQSRPLSELNAQLEKQGYYKAFPPAGVEVVSWYIVMGIGQVVTLRLPASRLREVNRVLENSAWGAYRTEFYPTYDYKAVGIAQHDKAQ